MWYSGGDGHAYGPETFTVEEKKKKLGPRNVERGRRPENITWMGPILPTYQPTSIRGTSIRPMLLQ